MRKLLVLIAAAGLAAPAPAVEQAKVDAAVAKAAEFFKKSNANARPAAIPGSGETALMGIAMLEAGVPPADPAMKAVIQTVRESALIQTQTYPVSLSILFLDRLNDPADVPTIQMLGVRLYAGMNVNGGWGYSTWEGTPDANELARLQKALQNRELETQPGPPQDPKEPKAPAPKPGAGKLHSEVEKVAILVTQALRARGRANAGDDNSNTQFGMIGLWVACRHGVPGKDAFLLVEKRFLATQNPRDAGWGYTSPMGVAGIVSGSTPAMTCAGLLGLALGAGARDAKMTAEQGQKPSDPKKPDSDPFSNPNDPNRPKPPAGNKPKPNDAAGLPKAVQAALASLGGFLQAAKGPNQQVPGRGGPGMDKPALGNLGAFVGVGNSYYMLWSLERMAVAYSLDTIGGVDWYDFGASLILAAQQADGSWTDTQYAAEVNTAFAVLFLTKSNLVRDLSGKIKGTKDPGKTELRSGGGPGQAPPLLAPPPPKDDTKPGGVKPPTQPADKPPAPGGGFTLPPVVQPDEASEAEKLATALMSAKDDWADKLAQYRDAKGGKWSRALATVCGKADGEKRKEAREALAERLTRMTAATLKTMLAEENAELRRAACLAVAMKEDRLLIPDLIDRLTDPSDPVSRAARAGLKSLSGVDFGPPSTADDDAKLASVAAWRAWHLSQMKK